MAFGERVPGRAPRQALQAAAPFPSLRWMTFSVALFAKRPRPGSVKTRLSPALPSLESALLYRAFLLDASARVASTPADRRVLYLADDLDGSDSPDPTAIDPDREWTRSFDEVRSQTGVDLGERLQRATRELLATPADRAMVIGADSPDLPREFLMQAVPALQRNDLVLGPTPDGGYYLIGLARPAPALFEGIGWSGPHVLEHTLQRARASRLRVEVLPDWPDVDEPADLLALIGRMVEEEATGRAPATARALQELGLLPAARA